MPDNRISATLGEAERQAVFAALQTIRQKLPYPTRSISPVGLCVCGQISKTMQASSL